MTRRVYQVLFLVSIVAFTFLFAKEIKGAASLFPHVDKVAHFGIFFALAVVMDKAFKLPYFRKHMKLDLHSDQRLRLAKEMYLKAILQLAKTQTVVALFRHAD